MSFLQKITAAGDAQVIINFYKNTYLPSLPSVFYKGEPLESGSTAIMTGFPSGIRHLLDSNLITKNHTICDYGAGRGRVSKQLREMGYKVYSYDPFNGSNVDGWNGVSSKLPKDKFDICFTSYVLNVVPEHIEESILRSCKKIAPVNYHVVRNMDILTDVKKALLSDPSLKNITKDDMIKFCIFGTQTSKGFQRIPMLEWKGWEVIKKESGWKLYG